MLQDLLHIDWKLFCKVTKPRVAMVMFYSVSLGPKDSQEVAEEAR